jgi:invasion protein IalB
MSPMPTETVLTNPHRHLIALILGGVGIFLFGAVVGTVTLHFWITSHDFRRTVATASFIQDWQLNCPPATQPASACALQQTIVQQGTNTPLAQLQISRGVSADSIRIVVPLGILIGPGLGFSVAGRPAQQVQYSTCDYAGCIAVTPLTAAERTQMEHGSGGQIVVVGRDAKAVNLPYSLKGFADAIRERDNDWRRRNGHWF